MSWHIRTLQVCLGISEYQYVGIPLSPAIAAEHILEYLSAQAKPVKRIEITRYVAQRHRELGGLVVGSAQNRVMTALTQLLDEGKVVNPSFGWYHFAENKDDQPKEAVLLSSTMVSEQLESELFASEETVGQGDELVNVYFHDADRKLANFENRDWWPCKVGFTAGTLTTRILAQGPLASMARPPIVGLVIRTENGYSLERAIHFALDAADARIAEALGSEWFDTSPSRIKAWHKSYCQLVESLRR